MGTSFTKAGVVPPCNKVAFTLSPAPTISPAPTTADPTSPPTSLPTRRPTNRPTSRPVEEDEPTEAPVDPTESPVDPTESPVDPTEAPVEPTEAPVEPEPESSSSSSDEFTMPPQARFEPDPSQVVVNDPSGTDDD